MSARRRFGRFAALAQAACLLGAGGCAARHAETAVSAAASADLAPLHGCETRELTLAGADVVVAANADGTLATVSVAGAADASARAAALREALRIFGPVRRDTEIVARQSKWGLVTWTDRCGRPQSHAPG